MPLRPARVGRVAAQREAFGFKLFRIARGERHVEALALEQPAERGAQAFPRRR
jgi:hypothetical protein